MADIKRIIRQLVKEMLVEMPHGDYTNVKVGYKKLANKLIDLRVERMNISDSEKKALLKSWFFNNGVAGKLKSKNKWVVFSQDNVYLSSKIPPDVLVLPDKWAKFAKIV